MTLDELKAEVPVQFQPWVAEYGPVFLAWTAQDIKDWLDLLLKGDTYAATLRIYNAMENQQAVDQWAALHGEWAQANAQNAARLDVIKAASAALLKVLLTIALAVLGF